MSSQTFSIKNYINCLNTDWKTVLLKYIDIYETDINSKIDEDLLSTAVYPPPELIFNAFNKFNYNQLKVVIIGQDPYINKGEAMGLSFSIPNECKIPPSLRNIFRELNEEFKEGYDNKDIKNLRNRDLTDWANQGVLMLNASLTVKQGESLSHMKIWKGYTTDIINHISSNCKNVVYILWGDFAKRYSKLIDKNNNLILEWSHPSPLCRKPFIGNNHFRLCNEYLENNNKEAIKWV